MSIIKWLQDNQENILFELDNKGSILFKFKNEPNKINDKEILLELLKTDAFIIKYANVELQNDQEVAKLTLNKSPYALKYLGQSIKDNLEIVDKAIQTSKDKVNSFDLILYAGELVKSNRDYIFKLLNNENTNGNFFRHVSYLHKNDRELNLLAVKKGLNLKYIDKKYSFDKEFLIHFVKQKAINLDRIPKEFENDQDIVLASLTKNNAESYRYASDLMKSDVKVIANALKINQQLIYETPKTFQMKISKNDIKTFIDKVLLEDNLNLTLDKKEEEPKRLKI